MINLPVAIKKEFPTPFLKAGEKILESGNYEHFDFIRNSYTAKIIDRNNGYWTTVKLKSNGNGIHHLCSCNTFLHHMKCQHIAALYILIYSRSPQTSSIDESLAKFYDESIWCSIARISYEYFGEDGIDLQAIKTSTPNGTAFILIGRDNDGQEIFEFSIPDIYLERFVQKYRSKFFKDIEDDEFGWEVYEESFQFLQAEKTDLEIRMNDSGYKSWLQKFEETYWFDLSKVWFMGLDDTGYQVEYSEKNQNLKIYSNDNNFKFNIPSNQVPRILQKLAQNDTIRQALNIRPEQVIINYSLEITDKHDLKVTPVLEMPGSEDPIKLTKKEKMRPAVLGKYLFIKNRGFFPFKRKIDYYDNSIFNFEETIIPNDKIVKFINEYKKYIDGDMFYHVSPSLKKQNMQRQSKRVDVFIDEVHEDWLYLSLKYRVGDETVTLYDIYKALREGKRFIIGKKIWIDLNHIDFRWIQSFLNTQESEFEFSEDNGESSVKINKMNFIKLNAHLPVRSKVKTRKNLEHLVKNLTNFKPVSLSPDLTKCNYQLRDYQKNGFEWLWFLYENKLSGLLCDDMGLGKTYQSLALLDALTFTNDRKMNFLVVCPTSVLPHWQEKLEQLKKKVHLHLYYGSDRQLKSLDKQKYAVILTSYGILRNDLEEFSKIDFEAAIFDEIQTAKNKASLTNAALNQLNSRMRIGLTGTPIENSLLELKALFDIVLPDYLGGDFTFRKQYTVPIERHHDKEKTHELQKVISPFILRRTKEQVLSELPPKIEDVRKCQLSEDQVRMYNKVIDERARSLITKLYDSDEKVPYIHIFAVLNQLKQICNHPSQVGEGDSDYTKFQSGKWDLFCELMDESLNSGFKVVVFSQYLNMLALIEKYLTDQSIQFASIKGSTINRKEMIDRFNNDPDCRVFTGSLRASGQGITLTGGSVVIHYDRWWNAAVENQATDRVHRIGQTRGVQVFKLITEGTMEEKIDLLIQKKKSLMDQLVQEDDANMVKNFSREELIDLLSFGDELNL